jgi:hypothetical protein
LIQNSRIATLSTKAGAIEKRPSLEISERDEVWVVKTNINNDTKHSEIRQKIDMFLLFSLILILTIFYLVMILGEILTFVQHSTPDL